MAWLWIVVVLLVVIGLVVGLMAIFDHGRPRRRQRPARRDP